MLSQMVDGGKQCLTVYGGVVEITQPIDLSNFGSSVDEQQAVDLRTAKDTVIRQADGANLDQLIKADTGIAEIDVTVDGNKANQTTAPTGVWIKNQMGRGSTTMRAFRCGTGLKAVGDTENQHLKAYVNACDLGVYQTADADGDTPDENRVHVLGHNNDGPFYRQDGGNITADLQINAESCPGRAIEHLDDGVLTVTGAFRGAGDDGIYATGEILNVDSLTIGAQNGGACIHVDGARAVIDSPNLTGVTGTEHGILVGSTTRTDNVKIVTPAIHGEYSQASIEIANSVGYHIDMPEEIRAGTSTGHAIRLATSGTTTGSMELASKMAGREIYVGANSHYSQIRFRGNMTDSNRASIPNPIEGMELLNRDDGLPNYYNGTDWTLPDGTVT